MVTASLAQSSDFGQKLFASKLPLSVMESDGKEWLGRCSLVSILLDDSHGDQEMSLEELGPQKPEGFLYSINFIVLGQVVHHDV